MLLDSSGRPSAARRPVDAHRCCCQWLFGRDPTRIWINWSGSVPSVLSRNMDPRASCCRQAGRALYSSTHPSRERKSNNTPAIVVEALRLLDKSSRKSPKVSPPGVLSRVCGLTERVINGLQPPVWWPISTSAPRYAQKPLVTSLVTGC